MHFDTLFSQGFKTNRQVVGLLAKGDVQGLQQQSVESSYWPPRRDPARLALTLNPSVISNYPSV